MIFSVNALENHSPDISQVLRKTSCGPFRGGFVCCVLASGGPSLAVSAENPPESPRGSPFATLFLPSPFCRNFRRPPPSLLRRGILKSHGNGQFGGSFRRCVRCDFVVSVDFHEFGYSPSPLKIVATCQKNIKKRKNVIFSESLLKR